MLHENSRAPRLTSVHSSACRLNFVKSLHHKRTGSCSQAPTPSILGGLSPLPLPQPEPPANSLVKVTPAPQATMPPSGDRRGTGSGGGGNGTSSLYFQLICSFSPNIETVPTPSLQCPQWHQPNPDTPQACRLLRPGTRLYGPIHPRNVAEVPASGKHLQSLHGRSSSHAKKSLAWAGTLLLESQCHLWLPSTSLPKLSGGSSCLSGILGSSMNFPMWLV